jgi:hypothetical protein
MTSLWVSPANQYLHVATVQEQVGQRLIFFSIRTCTLRNHEKTFFAYQQYEELVYLVVLDASPAGKGFQKKCLINTFRRPWRSQVQSLVPKAGRSGPDLENVIICGPHQN